MDVACVRLQQGQGGQHRILLNHPLAEQSVDDSGVGFKRFLPRVQLGPRQCRGTGH
jgi:hypothetical protein